MANKLYVTSRDDWTQEKLKLAWEEIQTIASEELELNEGEGYYPNQFEIVSSEQMIDAYASIGMPIMYNHWSFGKDFLRTQKSYAAGRQGLALEMVINSNPTINYLMEENSLVDQIMVLAHAGIGHNAVFKNNDCFKQWTNASSIVDYMVFARNFIAQCEQKYGMEEVELILDAAHALAPHGVDKFKRKHTPKMSEEARLQKMIEKDNQDQRELDIVLKRTKINNEEIEEEVDYDGDKGNEENLLYYIMKKSPNLDKWKRELIRIVYKVHQYWYPQSQTKNLNEGFASFTHYYIMTRLEEKGILSPDAYLAFLNSHSGVIFQPEYSKKYYSGLNPYTLGFNILMDVKRICENPTQEDKEWFPNLIGKRWIDAIKEATFEHRDDSFVMQYLSPKVIRDMKLFSVNVTEDKKGRKAIVSDIHDEVGYRQVRTNLARSFERVNRVPQIRVLGSDLEGDRTLYLEYVPYRGRRLDHESAELVAEYVDYLWGYNVVIEDDHEDKTK